MQSADADKKKCAISAVRTLPKSAPFPLPKIPQSAIPGPDMAMSRAHSGSQETNGTTETYRTNKILALSSPLTGFQPPLLASHVARANLLGGGGVLLTSAMQLSSRLDSPTAKAIIQYETSQASADL